MKLLNSFLKLDPHVGFSNYAPHQGERERARRIRQVLAGQLEMAGTRELSEAWRAQYEQHLL